MSENVLSNRLVSLDVFRGITIAGMVLVNNPGDWENIYSPLEHAAWSGWTPTDFIFPFFLFIVGIAISLSLGKRVESGGVTKDVYIKILRRTALIILIGLFLHAIPYFDFSTLRIPGVLQRIAVCYLIASLIFLKTNWKQQTIIGVAILLVYWILMTTIPVPGCEITSIDSKECNLAAYFDRLIFGANHIWSLGKVYDPEGFLSTIPAVATTISGILTGTWIKSKKENYEKVSGMFFFGCVLVVFGWIWSSFFPINKALWTSSYVLFTSGMALCFLGFCYWLIDIKGYKKWSKPFVIFGVNALALYIFSWIMSVLLDLIKVSTVDGKPVSLGLWIYENVFLSIVAAKNASLMYAISYILVWLFLMWILYRKRIFIKV
jgi:predicted acyltransferase